MFSKQVNIYVNGLKVEINVACTPNTPLVELKQKAIRIFTDKLYEENNCMC